MARMSRLLRKDVSFGGQLTIKEYQDEVFIKRYIKHRFGEGYLIEHIIDSSSGRRSARRPAPAEHVAEFQRNVICTMLV
uniref:Transposase n=1 Tax=Macrostomum lignano TaxID=282301 RepID=A0A1I8G9A9_9PLAT